MYFVIIIITYILSRYQGILIRRLGFGLRLGFGRSLRKNNSNDMARVNNSHDMPLDLNLIIGFRYKTSIIFSRHRYFLQKVNLPGLEPGSWHHQHPCHRPFPILGKRTEPQNSHYSRSKVIRNSLGLYVLDYWTHTCFAKDRNNIAEAIKWSLFIFEWVSSLFINRSNQQFLCL